MRDLHNVATEFDVSITNEEETMERKGVERRTLLKGSAALASMLGTGASPSTGAGTGRASADTLTPIQDQIGITIQRFRETIPPNFDRDYVENVVVPFFLTSLFEGERPMLPMIDINFSKQNALPFDLWPDLSRLAANP